MEKITIDTGVLIVLLEKITGFELIEKIIDWAESEKIMAFVSNRIFEPDTKKMRSEQVSELQEILFNAKVKTIGSLFRFGFSTLDGYDVLSGRKTNRKPDELIKFREVVGQDPTKLNLASVGEKLPNKIGDYDSLFDHYCELRDYFITLDTKDYLHSMKIIEYQEKLDLKIVSPKEYVNLHVEWL